MALLDKIKHILLPGKYSAKLTCLISVFQDLKIVFYL